MEIQGKQVEITKKGRHLSFFKTRREEGLDLIYAFGYLPLAFSEGNWWREGGERSFKKSVGGEDAQKVNTK